MRVYREKDFIDPKENIFVEMLYDPEEDIHTHEFIEIVYIYSGSGIQVVSDSSYNVSEGDLIFIDMGQTHSCRNSKNMKYVNILLKPEFVSNELINSSNVFEVFTLAAFDDFEGEIKNSVRMVSFEGSMKIKVRELVESMAAEFEEKNVGYRSALKGYVDILFAYVLRTMGGSGEEVRYMHGVADNMLQYIGENLSEKLTLSDLAAKCFYTPAYFGRMFKKCYKMSFKSYMKKMRIEKAAQYLAKTDMPIEKVIELVGYGERSLFFKHFKELMGETPGKFREEKNKSVQKSTQ